MFQSLDEEMEKTEGGRPKTFANLACLVGIVVLSAAVFGGLCLVVVGLE